MTLLVPCTIDHCFFISFSSLIVAMITMINLVYSVSNHQSASGCTYIRSHIPGNRDDKPAGGVGDFTGRGTVTRGTLLIPLNNLRTLFGTITRSHTNSLLHGHAHVRPKVWWQICIVFIKSRTPPGVWFPKSRLWGQESARFLRRIRCGC
jgi:hypothetical protein